LRPSIIEIALRAAWGLKSCATRRFLGSSIFRFFRKRRDVTRQSVIDMGFRPIPGQKFIESAHGVAVRHALKDAFEIGERLDVIEPCDCNERADGSPPSAATVGAREQVVLAPERDGPNRTLDRIVVEIDTAVIQATVER